MAPLSAWPAFEEPNGSVKSCDKSETPGGFIAARSRSHAQQPPTPEPGVGGGGGGGALRVSSSTASA